MLGGVQDSGEIRVSKKGKTSALLKHILLGADGKSIHELRNKIDPASKEELNLQSPRWVWRPKTIA